MYDLTVLAVVARHPAADAGGDLVIDGIQRRCHVIQGDLLGSVLADEHNGITDGGIGNVCHIHHQLIHADSAQNGAFVSPDQHVEAVTQGSAVAVGIAYGNGGYHGGLLGDKGTAVADGSAGRQLLDVGDPAVPAENGRNGQKLGADLIAGV